jgi:ABC-2 type transport system permease protein
MNAQPLVPLMDAEYLKLRSLRSTAVAAAVVTAASAVVGVAQVLEPTPGAAVPTLAEVALAPAQLAWLVVVVLAVLAGAGEFQHSTIRTTLLSCPRRVPVLLAKTAVAGTAGAVLVALGTLAAGLAAIVAAVLSGKPLGAGGVAAWAPVAGAVAVGAVWGALATGLGLLTRSSATSIAVVLLWRFVGEGVLPVVTRDPGLVRWTPTGAANALVGLGGDTLPVAAAAALLATYAALVCGTAAALFVRRDPV